jgi:hypothetical protein
MITSSYHFLLFDDISRKEEGGWNKIKLCSSLTTIQEMKKEVGIEVEGAIDIN